MNINERIFDKLKEKGMSQKELSKLTGISQSTISDWKNHNKVPGSDKLLLISKALGITVDELISDEAIPNSDESFVIDYFRKADAEQKSRILAYINKLSAMSGFEKMNQLTAKSEPNIVDADFLNKKLLARKLRKLARLDRIVLDESEHDSKLNLHLFKYLDYLGIDKLDYIKSYLKTIQPFMLTEMKSQEKFENAICVLDGGYRISLYIKVDATKGEEVIVSFHENNKGGIARSNHKNTNNSYVYVFADSIGSQVVGTDNYTINLFITRGVKTIPINVPATKYDEDGFLVRLSYITNAITDIVNQYLEELYTSDIEFSQIDLFSSLNQLSFTSYGNDIFSNISLLIDSVLVQKNPISKQVADGALCIYCSSVQLLENDKKELLEALKERFRVNASRVMPLLIERIENNLI